jgi:hypothetical protein
MFLSKSWKILENARINLNEFKNKELEKLETEGLIDEFDFMENVKSFEDFKQMIKTSEYWADMWGIGTIEEELNIKIIILSEESYFAGDLDSVMLCGHLNSEDINKTPEHYIILSHTGNHYKLITYKEKGLLKYREIPYDIKMLIINKCMEKNSGPYYLLKDFRELKMNMGLSSDEGSLINDEVINYVEQHNTMDSLRAPVVLDTTFVFPGDTIERPDLNDWMKRYRSGIQFEFSPW